MDITFGLVTVALVAGLIGLGMWYFGTVFPFRKYDKPGSTWEAIQEALKEKKTND